MTDKEMAEESLISYRKEPKWAGKVFMRDENTCYKDGFLAGLKAGRPKWHKLDWKKDFPDVDKLIRVRTRSGTEHICETYSYEPAEDEIGYGHCITQFSELNGDWVDDNEVKYWCEIEPFKE